MKNSWKIGRKVWNIRLSREAQWKVWKCVKLTETVEEKSEKVWKKSEKVLEKSEKVLEKSDKVLEKS